MFKEGWNVIWPSGRKPCLYLLDYIEYHLPLKFLPPPHEHSNHRSAKEHYEFVNEAVNKLVVNRHAIKICKKPYLCSPLMIAWNSTGKLRLVLSFKYLSQFLHKDSFKYEDLHIAALMFEQHELLFKSIWNQAIIMWIFTQTTKNT